MSRPEGMTKREWLDKGWPDDAYFSYDYGGLDDDQLFFYFKRADRQMVEDAFTLLKNGGAMADFSIEEHVQPFSVQAISHGWRVYPKEVDFAFMSMEAIKETLMQFFNRNGVELAYLSFHKLLNLPPRW